MASSQKPAQAGPLRSRKRDVAVDLLGMSAIVLLTVFLFERTQQTAMLVIGGLVLAVSVLGAFMRS